MYIKRPSEHNHQNAPKPEDRRTIKRRHLIFYLRVWELTSDRLLGHVVDITPEGMMLISEQPIATGKEYKLEIRTPDTEGEIKPLRFKAMCRWSDNDVNPVFYDSGFEFLEKTPKDIETIIKMVDDYGFND
ncbi:MAG: PilZ domain-containing protein [Candidatus Thiodiazotropha sp. (ex Myrtea spinifera)]|nr:PilZ domain-containing protein [Candidatus Thiodiazotropha sp. (ex Myrtea spinifera)]MCU7827845.1 PilZ domain-containing protein [Candidatus Thiodiazotropha sp. (ex Myrtea sp. 'scaly one' KF741663)]MCU7914432.1 PilZ domain-containing protein [Candidatus Thiodiazotropha sp. (ex Gloverina cf. vestifex)]